MSARVPQSGGRPWVAVHTWMLNDPDVLLAGNAARALWLSLLLWSAQAGTAGVVPADARRVATFARLDGGVPEVADALASLVAQGLLVAGPNDGTYAIGAWAETQADLGGSTTRSASTSAAKFKSAHEAGKHARGARDGCPLCEAGHPGLAVVPEPPGPDGGSPDGDSPEGLPQGGARELVSEFRATFAGVLDACPTRLDGYRVLLDAARGLGAEHAGMSPRLGPALAHEVLADALGHYLGIGPDVLPRAYRGANALSEDDGAYWWIRAAQDAAGRDIAPGSEIAYVQAVAASKRAAWLAGGLWRRTVGEVIAHAMDELEVRREFGVTGWATGIASLDGRVRQVMAPGRVVCIAGGTKSGKTALAGQVVVALAAQGVPVLLGSFEDDQPDTMLRYLANLTSGDVGTIRDGFVLLDGTRLPIPDSFDTARQALSALSIQLIAG